MSLFPKLSHLLRYLGASRLILCAEQLKTTTRLSSPESLGSWEGFLGSSSSGHRMDLFSTQHSSGVTLASFIHIDLCSGTLHQAAGSDRLGSGFCSL